MIEIQTSTEIEAPSVAVCLGGNICLYMPAHWDINEALAYCEPELLSLLHKRFKALFASDDYPRVFGMVAERLSIQPDFAKLPNPVNHFEGFLDT